jgi:hypothetical protein
MVYFKIGVIEVAERIHPLLSCCHTDTTRNPVAGVEAFPAICVWRM